MFIEELVKEIYEDKYFNELYDKLCNLFVRTTFSFQTEKLTVKELKDILRFADILSNSQESLAKNKSYKIISLLKKAYEGNKIYKAYSIAILKKISNFPALDNCDDIALPIDREIEYGLKKIEYKIPVGKGYFTPAQYKIYEMIKKSSFFSFSGPTSMGKSFIIKQFIMEKIQTDPFIKGFCILVPSKALIKQYLLEFKKALNELNITRFNVLTTPNILEFAEFEENNFIFILTPERLLNLLSSTKQIQLDYLIIDEAHKLFNDDDRALTYYTSIDYCITKFKFIKVIMSSPLINNPDIYANMYYKREAASIRTLETPVSQNLFYIDTFESTIDFYDNKEYHFNISKIKKLHTTNGILYGIGKGNSLIYVNSTNQMIEEAMSLCTYFEENNIDILNNQEKIKLKEVCELIAKILHPKYYLIECLKLGIGYHYGNLPIIIREQVEELFKDGTIKYLFCTSTLLEGVNMPAKNVFILSDKIGRKNISKIDFWNLAGRAGRLGYEFYGNIFCIKTKENMWKHKEIFEEKNEIRAEDKLKYTLNKKNKEIKKIIEDNEIRQDISKQEKYINYISNLIQIDSIAEQDTSMIKQITEIDNGTVNDCRTFKNEVDIDVLNANRSIDIKVQNRVNNNLFMEKMPTIINTKVCFSILSNMYNLYRWDIKEKNLQKKGVLKYIALLMAKWINDMPLSRIISQTIQYYDKNNKEVWVNNQPIGVFDISNKSHINILINQTINDIEHILKFDLEKYFNHYYMLIKSKYGEENIGSNWAMNLEFGTRNNKNIILQNNGFSRYCANILLNKYKEYLVFEDDILKTIKSDITKTQAVSNSVLKNELFKWFGIKNIEIKDM